MINKQISHYKVIDKLGEGGMGEVFLAEDTKLKRKVAIKFLPSNLAKDKESRERFEREAQAAAVLNHPNIVTVYEIGEFENQIYISMEYLEGELLRDKIDNHNSTSTEIPIEEIINISAQICEGLEKAHQAGIVHRDIKPGNIIIDKDNRVKILDFGLAKLKGVSQLTKENSTIGTIQYMSPEESRGEIVDARTDIWSFGVVLYEMLAGHYPFIGDYEQAVLYSILNEDPVPIENLQKIISEEMNQLVKKLLKKDLHERYQNINEIKSDLKSIENKLKTQKSKIENSKQSLSIVVLPFVNMSADPENEYFSDGLSEELINALCKIKELHVVARTSAFSFKGKEMDVRDIGKKLNVERVLEGSVRKAGDQLRITAQLINVTDGYHIWSEKYDRKLDDIFAIQDDISFQITESLKSKLVTVPKEDPEKHTSNLEAYDFYLKGKYYWNEYSAEWTNKAIDCFKKAIEKDHKFALAYATLSSVYVFQSTPLGSLPGKIAMPKAREAAQKALYLDPNLTEAYVALGAISTFYDWDGDKSIEYFQRAINLNPNSADARLWIEFPLSLIRHDFNESINQLNHVLELDPLNLIIRLRLGYVYVYKYEFDRAIEHFQKILEIEPNFVLGHHGLMDVYGQTGMYEEAISRGEQVLKLAGRAQAHLGALAYCYGKAGRKNDALNIISEFLDQPKQGYTSPFWIATIYMGLNEPDHVFEWLEKAYEDRDGNLLYIMAPPFDPIRTDPRYNNLLNKMGLVK